MRSRMSPFLGYDGDFEICVDTRRELLLKQLDVPVQRMGITKSHILDSRAGKLLSRKVCP